MELTLKDIWAKTEPFQSIQTHAALAGIVAQTLWDTMLPVGVKMQLAKRLSFEQVQVRAWLGYLISLHDLGKVEENFQYQWPPMRQRIDEAGLKPGFFTSHVRHEKTTQETLRKNIWPKTKETKRMRRFYAGILGAHHQGKNGDVGSLKKPFWNSLQVQLEEEMRQYFLQEDTLTFPEMSEKDEGTVGVFLLGMTVLSDWIASGDLFTDAEEWFDPRKTRAGAEEKIVAFLKQSGLCGENITDQTSFSAVWPNISKVGMRGLQEETERLFTETEERISAVLVEAPMGEGKTEAGIYAAIQMARQWGKTGFYVGLPTAATSNQMVGRMRELLSLHRADETVRLLHSMAWLEEDIPQIHFNTEEERYAAGWLLPVRRGLLSPYAVGTVDQAMMAVLMIKYGVLRLFGLAEKTLVIDELHSYDVYMSELLQRLLEWCKGLEIPVVMLSATLPPEKKAQMLSPYAAESAAQVYPAITAVTESGKVLVRKIQRTEKHSVVSVKLLPLLQDSNRIAQRAAEYVREGGCLCVLLNTVDQAQEVYQCLQQEFDGELLLFHARFPAERRQEIERQCIRWFGKDKQHRPPKAILVATQVVEQSLDVDFDAMLTAVAPIDLLLQRVGRVFRHRETPRLPQFTEPTLFVLIPEEEGEYGVNECIYPTCLLSQSIYLLQQREHIRIPEDLPQLVAEGYDPAAAPPEELEHWMEHLIDGQVKAGASTQYLIRPPEKGFSPIREPESIQFDDLEQSTYLSAKTRLGEPSKRIVLLEQGAFQRLKAHAKREEERCCLEHLSREDEIKLMKQSVSVSEGRLKENKTPASVLYGKKRLEGLEIFSASIDKQGRMYYSGFQETLVLDDDLGILFQKGERA